jgi:hypothetical protein
MLTTHTQTAIHQETISYWRTEVKKPEIIAIAQGKEMGHKLADVVDEKTTALLTINHLVKHQVDARGRRCARSMGDLWLHDCGIFHAINVKTGIVGAEGQPNLVSLKKIIRAIMARQIDAYYLLIVKLLVEPGRIVPSVFLIDMLDWLDYVTFDSGPGQMMLKAVKFFAEYQPHKKPCLTTKQKLSRLIALYEDGERRLVENRARDLNHYKRLFDQFMSNDDFAVTSETQQTLLLQ